MTLTGVETQPVPQALPSDTQSRNQVAAVKPRDDASDKPKGRQETREVAPIQDQVTLSGDAQALSASNPQTSNNNTFEQSPFDR